MAKKPTKKKPAKKKPPTRVRRLAALERKLIAKLAEPEDDIRVEGRGKTTLYRPEYAQVAASMCKLGATDWQLAEHFKVDLKTIKNWENRYSSFFKALRRGKGAADERVERTLYHKAVGYTFESEKIFYDTKCGEVVRVPTLEHVPPSDNAISMWLRNRMPDKWRDKVDHDHSHTFAQLKIREGEMTIAESQAIYRQLRNMPLHELERQFKLVEPPKTIDNETGEDVLLDEDQDA